MKKMLILLLIFTITLSVVSSSGAGSNTQKYGLGIDNQNQIVTSINYLHRSMDSFSDWMQVNKIIPLDDTSNSYFGKSVSMDKNSIVIGAPWHDYRGDYSGVAYVYHYIGSQYIHQTTLSALDGQEWDNFGFSVSISDDRVVVGAPWHKQNEIRTGAAYVFTRRGNDWIEHAKLVAFDGEEEDFFGSSVALYGDYVVVGAPWHNSYGVYSGAVYVYKQVSGNWIFQHKLVASDAQAYELFGSSVALCGDYMVVGARGSQGSAYIFSLQDSQWVEQVKLVDQQGQAADYFGCSVAIDNEFVVIGAKGVNHSRGSAYVYQLTDVTWEKHSQLNSSDGVSGDSFGFSVDISANSILIGAPGSFNDRGCAYMFRLSGSTWELEDILVGSDTNSDDQFGYSVCITDTIALCSAPFQIIDEIQTGSCYVYQRKDTIQQVFIFGRIKNLTDYEQYITFQAVATNVMTFFPFRVSRYRSEETFVISNDYNYINFGLFGVRYIVAWSKLIR